MIRYGKRPWFAPLLRLFGMKPGPGVIYTVGRTIYSPGPLTGDLLAHEATHTRQQRPWGLGPLLWWTRYMLSPRFRLEQEMQAYAEQFRYIQARTPRRYHLRVLMAFAEIVSGPMYGSILTPQEAVADLRRRVTTTEAGGNKAFGKVGKVTTTA